VSHPDGGNSAIRTHLLVTPARNEAENLTRLAECLAAQTWQPTEWVVVENGSTDGTPDVVRELGERYSWIHLVSIESDPKPLRGRSSVRAFNAGVAAVSPYADLITNLDADVSFEPAYFDLLRREFEANPRLGIASGLCYELGADDWEPIHVTHPHLRGAARTYRRECLEQLLPLEELLGWDGIDVVRANIRNWETGTVPTLGYFHHRATGARDASRFSSYAEEGDAAYYMWYRPSYLVARTLYRAVRSRDPAVLGLTWGYARSALARKPRHAETGFREFVHSTQSVTRWQDRAREVLGKT
jgi:glycosyltransferase involved in cell wall biosynthesis